MKDKLRENSSYGSIPKGRGFLILAGSGKMKYSKGESSIPGLNEWDAEDEQRA